MIIEEGVKIVETAGSNPKKWIALFKKAGLYTIHKCVTIRHALSAQRLGVSCISLDGFECAGHPGEGDVGNYVLQAKGARVLTTPFICSGGVGDGWCFVSFSSFSLFVSLYSLRPPHLTAIHSTAPHPKPSHPGKQLAAALALGAEGVNCGTRFCATKECSWPEAFKKAMV